MHVCVCVCRKKRTIMYQLHSGSATVLLLSVVLSYILPSIVWLIVTLLMMNVLITQVRTSEHKPHETLCRERAVRNVKTTHVKLHET